MYPPPSKGVRMGTKEVGNLVARGNCWYGGRGGIHNYSYSFIIAIK